MFQLYLSSATVGYAKLLIFDSVDTTTEKFGNEKMILFNPYISTSYIHITQEMTGKRKAGSSIMFHLVFSFKGLH